MNAAAGANRASYVSHQHLLNPDGSITRLNGSMREGAAPVNKLTANDKSNTAIRSLLHHSRLNMKGGDTKQPLVRNGFSHDELVTRFGSFIPPSAPLHSRDRDRRLVFGKSRPRAKAAAEPAGGSITPVKE